MCAPAAGLAAAPVILGATLLVPYYQSSAGGRNRFASDKCGYREAPMELRISSRQRRRSQSGGAGHSKRRRVHSANKARSSVCSVNLSNRGEDWCLETGDDYNSLAVYKNVVYVNTYSHGVFRVQRIQRFPDLAPTCRPPATTRAQTTRPRLPMGIVLRRRRRLRRETSTRSTHRPER